MDSRRTDKPVSLVVKPGLGKALYQPAQPYSRKPITSKWQQSECCYYYYHLLVEKNFCQGGFLYCCHATTKVFYRTTPCQAGAIIGSVIGKLNRGQTFVMAK